MFFVTKQRHIENQLGIYRQQVSECIAQMVLTFRKCKGDYDRAALEESIAAVSRCESRADDIRREIEVNMYTKALFPESRGDILGIIEAIDKVPNQAEDVVRMIKTHHIMIPLDFQPGMLQLAETCQDCVTYLLDAAGKLFTDFAGATVSIAKTERLEGAADRFEADLTDRVFSSPLSGTKKLLMRDLIKYLARVSDKAEDAGDRIRIVVAKRGV